jgi:hypothetical protein
MGIKMEQDNLSTKTNTMTTTEISIDATRSRIGFDVEYTIPTAEHEDKEYSVFIKHTDLRQHVLDWDLNGIYNRTDAAAWISLDLETWIKINQDYAISHFITHNVKTHK